MLQLAVLLVCTLTVSAGATSDFIVRLKHKSGGALEGIRQASREDVYHLLSQHATKSQQSVLQLLRSRSVEHESLWIENAVAVKSVSKSVLLEIKGHDDVLSVDVDERIYLPELGLPPTPSKQEQAFWDANRATAEEEAAKPQGNVEALNTGKLWDAGIKGEGVVLATIDSGVRWTHEALRGNYRGFLQSATKEADHDYSFWDPHSAPLTPDTADIYGHGSHVTGTAAGSGPYNIGMAPNVTWIHARAFSWDGASSQSTLIQAAQWVLCPTKYDHTGANCSKGADVVSCSFGGNSSLTWLNPSVKALRAAGVLPVFAAGNVNAFECGSVMEPGGFIDSIAVGGSNGGELYPSSGKGPGLDGKTIKPDFVAPSLAINSVLSAADSGRDAYVRLTGTSMATPHVSGGLALLLSALKQARLRGGTAAVDVLAAMRNTTQRTFKKPFAAKSSCGGTEWNVFPNNIYGWGLPDVCAAAALSDHAIQCA